MTAVTVIVDALLTKLRLISEFSKPDCVCDGRYSSTFIKIFLMAEPPEMHCSIPY